MLEIRTQMHGGLLYFSDISWELFIMPPFSMKCFASFEDSMIPFRKLISEDVMTFTYVWVIQMYWVHSKSYKRRLKAFQPQEVVSIVFAWSWGMNWGSQECTFNAEGYSSPFFRTRQFEEQLLKAPSAHWLTLYGAHGKHWWLPLEAFRCLMKVKIVGAALVMLSHWAECYALMESCTLRDLHSLSPNDSDTQWIMSKWIEWSSMVH